jgi:hypothetical protein
MTKRTRDRLDKIDNQLYRLKNLFQVLEHNDFCQYYQDISMSEVLKRLGELYNYLGVKRVNIPPEVKLVKNKPSV